MSKTTKEKINVMQAYVDGKQIEVTYKGLVKWEDFQDNSLAANWDWVGNDYRIKPKKTLEQKIKAKYSGFDVEILGYCKVNGWLGLVEEDGAREPHIYAQCMKGFYRYVYQHPDGDLDTNTSPTEQWDKGVTLQPVAVLFTKEGE